MADDLLFSAKLEQAYQPFYQELELLSLFKNTLDRYVDKYPEFKFKIDFPENEINARADKSAMVSIMVNLLENAIKYSPQDKEIEVALKAGSEEVSLKVADKGIGIPDNLKNKIFQKFYRAGNEDTRKTKGTGLGLYIIKQLVVAHNGKISVLDNHPKGAIFTVRLPLGC